MRNPALEREYQTKIDEALERYVAQAVERLVPLKSEREGEELYAYRAPGTERPCVIKRLPSGHWLIRSGYADDADPETWHRVKGKRAREVLKLARAAQGAQR